MIRETKHIDKLFGDKLAGLKSPVPSDAWNRLEQELDAGQRKKMIFWFRLAAASVLLILAFGAGFYFAGLVNEKQVLVQSNDTKNQSEVLNPEKNQTSGAVSDGIDQTTFGQSDEVPLESTSQKKSTINQNIQNDVKSDIALANEKTDEQPGRYVENKVPEHSQELNTVNLREPILLRSLANIQPQGIFETVSYPGLVPVRNQQPVYTGIADPSTMNYGDSYFENPVPDNTSNNKWTVGGQFAPTYSFRDISTSYSNGQVANSVAEEKKLNAAEEGLMAYAGGMNVDYNVKGKWSVQSGLYFSRIGQVNTDALEFSQNDKQFVLVAIHTSTGDINLEIDNIPPGIRSFQSPKDSIGAADIGPVKVVQNFDFFEIPFLVKYKLLDKKLALNFTGGLSPAYLVKNTTYLEFEGNRYNAGDAANLNNMMVNTSLGMGLEFSFTKQLILNFQPTFKYALSPINSSTAFNYHPYSFSWFTGISYQF